MFKVSPHFYIQELVAPEIIARFGEHRAANMIHQLAIDTLEQLRADTGEHGIGINNYHAGGDRKYSGLRPPDCPIGAALSGHKFTLCFDMHHYTLPPAVFAKFILDHQESYPYIIRMENPKVTTGWVHIETGWRGRIGVQPIYVFNP
jgi:hypothetical protein